MRDSIHSFSQSLKRVLFLSLCLIAGIAIAGHVYVQVLLADNARLSQIISLSERQRVKGQQMARSVNSAGVPLPCFAWAPCGKPSQAKDLFVSASNLMLFSHVPNFFVLS